MPRRRFPKPQYPAIGFQPSLPGTERDHVSSAWLIERCCCECGGRFATGARTTMCALHDTGKAWMFHINERQKLGSLASYKLIGHKAHKECAVFEKFTVTFAPTLMATAVKQDVELYICPDCRGPD